MFSKHGEEVLSDMVKERQPDQGCVQSFRSVHLSGSRGESVAGASTPRRKDYAEEKHFICDKLMSQNQVQGVLACDKSRPSRRVRNSFSLIAAECVERSELCIARELLLFRLKFETDSGKAEYVFLQYMKCTPLLDEVDMIWAVCV